MSYNFKRDCRNILKHIKTPKQRGGCMPYDTGHLARAGCSGRFFGDNKFTFTMNTGSKYDRGGKGKEGTPFGAEYAIYLNTGSKPHDIPNAFGVWESSGHTIPLGIGGRFNGKFHPGSFKHVGFYDNPKNPNSILEYTIQYFVKHYDAGVLIEKKGK